MAELPEIRPGTWPDPVPPDPSGAISPLRPIGGRTPRFGVAHELDLIQRGAVTPGGGFGGAASRRRAMAAAHPEPGAWDRLGTWWAGRELSPVDLWHRLRCRSGHHDVQGGRQIQVGGGFRHTERCCVWCRAKPQ